MGQNRTEVSIPCPLTHLPHRCGAGICLSVSKSCKGHGDKGEPWTSKAPRWNQWSGIVWPHTNMGKALICHIYLSLLFVSVSFCCCCLWGVFCLFVFVWVWFWEEKFWLNFWGKFQIVLWELLHTRLPYVSTAWCPGWKFIQKNSKF